MYTHISRNVDALDLATPYTTRQLWNVGQINTFRNSYQDDDPKTVEAKLRYLFDRCAPRHNLKLYTIEEWA